MLLVWAARDWCAGSRRRRWVAGMGAGLLIVLLGACAWRQAGFWRDSETLWRHALACTSGNFVAHNNLGGVLLEHGQTAEAQAQFRQALEINPNCEYTLVSLGHLLVCDGHVAEAIAMHRRALEICPNDADAHYFLGVDLQLSGQTAEAIAEYERAIELNPRHVESLNLIARIRAIHPDATFRNATHAVAFAKRAVELGRNNPLYWDTLAAAYAASGQLTEAAHTQRHALDLATQQNQTSLANALQARLQLYESPSAPREQPTASPARP
jgi:protein O-mannosyl-transferase